MQDGIHPLYVSSLLGHAEVVDTLLKNGADPNLTTKVQSLYKCCDINPWHTYTVRITIVASYVCMLLVFYHHAHLDHAHLDPEIYIDTYEITYNPGFCFKMLRSEATYIICFP